MVTLKDGCFYWVKTAPYYNWTVGLCCLDRETAHFEVMGYNGRFEAKELTQIGPEIGYGPVLQED